MDSTTCVSAPGKVLLAGGYLVVDRNYQGLVLGLSARIHVVVQTWHVKSTGSIVVRSPQFQGAEWKYACAPGKGNGVDVQQLGIGPGTSPRNKFVETALAYALSYMSYHGEQELPSLDITILADSDYYSHSRTSTANSKDPESQFKHFGVKLQEAHKTGLGSSAALVSAFVSAVVLHCMNGKESAVDQDMKRKLHNLAQTAHCVAQGKIGSGFDVAAAVYGACIYRRFSPSILDQIGGIGSDAFETRLGKTVNEQLWDTEIDASAIDLPRGLRLVMCDVDCGSETPGMVKKVMSWRREQPEESIKLWAKLSESNMHLAADLQRLQSEPDSAAAILTKDIEEIRVLIREMSVKADVPIEPPVQTHLLDGCSALEGVVGGVVPGAGGYDALSVIIEDKPEVLQRLEDYLKAYQSPKALAQGREIGHVRLLNVMQEAEGLRLEAKEQYRAWIS